MKLPAGYQSTLEELVDAWNKAEHSIKIAENVCGDVVAPAINELRYAGRKLVESWNLLQAHNPEDASERLRDAMFDCCRAEHDAIDTATAAMAERLLNAVDSMGYDVVLRVYPDFSKLSQRITATQRLAEESRKDRNNRQATYDMMQTSYFPETANDYRAFLDSDNLMRAIAKKERWRKLGSWVGYGVGVLGLIIAFFAWRFPVQP
jgi:hypothetical protein